MVDDTAEFHKANMNSNNHSHYSVFAKRLPYAMTEAVQNSGSQIYFNPLIPLKTFPH